MGNTYNKILGRNLRLPGDGFWGWYTVNCILKPRNRAVEELAAQLSDIKPHHHVLEVGFGPGIGLKAALSYVTGGKGRVYGIDLSHAMVKDLQKLLIREIKSGKLDIKQGDVHRLPYESNKFDRVFHVNSFYFWGDLAQSTRELYRVSRPDALVVVTMNPHRIQNYVRMGALPGTNTDLNSYIDYMRIAGFQNTRLETLQGGNVKTVFAEVRHDK